MTENDLLDEELDIEEQEESRLKIFLKKTYIIILAIILLLLFVINSAPGYHVISVLSGKIVSSTLNEDYTFDLKYGGKVLFEKGVFERLRQIYLANQKHEFKVCLQGYKENKNYFANDIYIPRIYKQDVFSVSSQLCDKDTIISLHSHPPLRCIFSQQDIRSFESFRRINPDGIIGLMCNKERLSFFGYVQ